MQIEPSKLVIIGLAAAALVLGTGAASEATEWKVRKLTYHNDGAYRSWFYVRWDKEHVRVKCLIGRKGDRGTLGVGSGNKMTLNLTRKAGLHHVDKETCDDFKEGVEVWGWVEIDGGEKKSCRHSDRFFFYKDGGEVVYKTKGTTHDGNHCHIVKKPKGYER